MKFLVTIFCILVLCCSNPDQPVDNSILVPELIKEDSLPVDLKRMASPDYDTLKWADIALLDATIDLDIRYATTNNFVNEKLYNCGRCFLRPKAAAALLKAQESLMKQNLGLKLLDCYRPRPVQQKLWDKFQDATYVTPPEKGSMHNRGLAVDLTIVDEKGKELDMGTPFDFFGRKAHHTFLDLPEEVLANRSLLKQTMESVGFKSIRTEWWHYSYTKHSYPLSDMIWNCDHQTR